MSRVRGPGFLAGEGISRSDYRKLFRGFRGHLGALRHGEVTTGTVKLGGIGVTAILSAVVAGGPAADVALNAGLVAGGANLLNLFDLRPGRAIKVAVAIGAPGAISTAAGSSS